MMDQAKHYYIFHLDPFHRLVLEYLLESDHGFKLRYHGLDLRTRVFCGKRKKKKMIEELYLLGYDDSFIVEVKEWRQT